MKLRNKKTGEIVEDVEFRIYTFVDGFGIRTAEKDYDYTTLAKLVEDWEDCEDYSPQEPLIKDEKIRKAVRAWAEANYDITEVYYDKNKRTFGETTSLKVITVSEILDDNLEDNRVYTIAELCGEEEDD